MSCLDSIRHKTYFLHLIEFNRYLVFYFVDKNLYSLHKKLTKISNMKKIPTILMIIFMISCQQQEDISTDLNAQEISLDLSDLEDLELLKQMASEFKATADGLNEIDLDDSTKLRLESLSELMLSNYIFFKELSLYKKGNVTNKTLCRYLSYPECQQEYNTCVWWAKSWDDLLRKCNGPVSNRPSNCTQIRLDYIKNLDKIESTYHKCSNKFKSCIGCSSGPQGPL